MNDIVHRSAAEPVPEPATGPVIEQVRRVVQPVIMCGGSGKRLWPVSRQACPKQFQGLYSDKSLLQETALRARDGLALGAPMVLCNEEHRFMVHDHLREVGLEPAAVVCEPAPRNTGPALTVAALMLYEQDPDALMLAMPADHFIGDVAAFGAAFRQACLAAERDLLVTFGIRPDRPEIGYGYIEQGDYLEGVETVHAVARFVEKPTRPIAEQLVEDGRYLWNSGIFLLPVRTFLDEVRAHNPQMEMACAEALAAADRTHGRVLLEGEAFARAPKLSVDVAVMERTTRAAVVRARMGWSDLGTWPALRDMGAMDGHGNVLRGNTAIEDVSNCFIQTDGRLVAAVGLDDVVIVDTDDVVLVSSAAYAGRIDELVGRLTESGQREALHHARVHRPWGHYQTVQMGDRFQVKHILVKPGQQLSLQMHHHRAEHWIIVSGTGRITCDGETRLLHENQSVHIPVGACHRLENPGKIPLCLIEVQLGAYLGEDDIVRFDDQYGRV